MTHIRKLVTYAARWGIKVRMGFELDRHDTREYNDGPDQYDIMTWSTKPVIVSGLKSHGEWPWLLHEIAHAICPTKPEDTKELVDTTGIELLSIEYLKLPFRDWEQWQNGFVVGKLIGCVSAHSWINAPPSWRKSAMIKACNEARARGHFHPKTSEPLFRLYRLKDGKRVAIS